MNKSTAYPLRAMAATSMQTGSKLCASHARPKAAAKKSNSAFCPPLLARDVVAAVESLYADDLQPTSRILQKRISERIAPAPCSRDLQRLRAICTANPLLMVVAEGGSDWSACLVGREPNFKDVHDTTDSYPEEMWVNLKAYIERCPCNSAAVRLPGGRYESAKALRQQCPAFLGGRSLGEVCHIVQLALNQRKILGYSNGCMVPYHHSQSQAKENCAKLQRACSGSGGDPARMPVATWDVARSCLQQILESAPSHEVPLPNVKRFFCSRFNVQLSETLLGYSKVSDLLQDSHFHDICRVKLQGSSYMVSLAEKQESSVISLSDNLFPSEESCIPAADHSEQLQSNAFVQFYMPQTCQDAHFTNPSNAPVVLDAGLVDAPSFKEEERCDWVVKNTFIHAAASMDFRVKRRNLTVPKEMSLSKGGMPLSETAAENVELADAPDSPLSGSTGVLSCDQKPISLSRSNSNESYFELEAERHQQLLDPMAHIVQSAEDKEKADGGRSSHDDHDADAEQDLTTKNSHRVSFCIEEPLTLEQEDNIATRNLHATALLNKLPLTPGMLQQEGYCINNTFIDVAPCPPEQKRSSQRSRTLHL